MNRPISEHSVKPHYFRYSSDNVPAGWTKLAYASDYGLASWYADLLLRIRELDVWTQDFTLPASVWMGGLFNPQSFLTAIMQVISGEWHGLIGVSKWVENGRRPPGEGSGMGARVIL
jgi:hypothetical protein